MGEIEVKGFKVECESCGDSIWSGTAFRCNECETVLCKKCNEEYNVDTGEDPDVLALSSIEFSTCKYCGYVYQ